MHNLGVSRLKRTGTDGLKASILSVYILVDVSNKNTHQSQCHAELEYARRPQVSEKSA